MKRKSQWFALLTALCLLAGMAVVPAAAADLDELKNAVTSAETALSEAKTALSEAESALSAAKDDPGVKAAESAVADAEKAVEESEQALKDAEDSVTEENPEVPNKEALEQAIADAKDKLSSAKSSLEDAKKSADVDGKQSAVDAAKAAVSEKQSALDKAKEDLKKAEEANKPSKPAAPVKGDFTIYPSSYSFGVLEVGVSKGTSKTITVTNESAVEMRIDYTEDRGSGFSITGLPMRVPAESEKTFTVSLDSTSKVKKFSETFTITAAFDDGSFDRTLEVSAEVAEEGYSLSVDPTSKDLGKLKEGYSSKEAKEKAVTVTLKNRGNSDLRLDGVKGDEHFDVTAVNSKSDWLSAGEKAEFKVTPMDDLKAGTYTDKIIFKTREGATAELKATLVVEKKVDSLTVDPAVLDFGTVEEGYSALTPKTVTVKNNSDYAMRLNQPTSYSYEIGGLTQTTLSAGSSATFTIRPRTGMPQGAYSGVVEVMTSEYLARLEVRFTVTAKAGPSAYPDVPSDSTFASDIAYVSQKGLMGGKSDGNFKPQDAITRGQLVTILYRLEGQPAVSGVGFSDVAAGSYCERAVKWASANRITNGNEDGTFRPDEPISRQQMATFLYRYNNYKGYMVAKQADLSSFPDGASVASYAKDALSWANGIGLVNGTSDGRLNPSGGATRGQAAAILHRFCASIGR